MTTRRPDPRPARTRRTILDALAELAADQGFEDTAITEVAVRAQVAVGTIYTHFGSKENLVLELLELVAEPRFAALQLARAEGSPREAVLAVGRAIVEFAIEEPVAYGAWVAGRPGAADRGGSDAGRRLAVRLEATADALRADLRRMIDAGALQSTDVGEIAAALVGLWVGIAGSVARRDRWSMSAPVARRALARGEALLT